MKVLSWMHRKLQKDSTGFFKGSNIGSSCLLLKQEYQNSHYYLNEFKPERTEEIYEISDEIFPGFLTIGTLSVETITDPPTPTLFDFPYQETDVETTIQEIKYDLKLINDELEKFLKAEAGKEGCNEIESSDRKDSEPSTLSLIGKENEEEEEDELKFVIMKEYPLQGYLLASSTGKEKEQKAKKEKTFLKKLLQKTRVATGSSHKKPEETQKQTKKEFKPSIHVMTMTLQTDESSPAVGKLKKIKRLFHKKIHPEDGKATKDPNRYSKYDNEKILKNSGYSYPTSELSCESNRMGCWGTFKKGYNHQSKIDMNPSQETTSINEANAHTKEINDGAGREHWVNTDADYLVLEL